MQKQPLNILTQYWGYPAFRPMQENIIRSILSGKDTLALLPTGGGKSICFQVPALLQEKLCIVISPLIALMKDQVEALQRRGIAAAAIFSGMSYREIQQVLDVALENKLSFIYLSPERIHSRQFQQFLNHVRPGLLAVDEAHCISQWGYDFRPAYLRIKEMREWLPGVPVLALTASATRKVQEDICVRLGFEKENIFLQSFYRPNLLYEVHHPEAKPSHLVDILKKEKGCGIVYCRSRKQTKQISELLTLHHISADYYHAGLTTSVRNRKQEDWLHNKTRIMVCTNAFGMGIDKPDVRMVIHADMPDCLENYYQEAGRAGRDGKPALAILFTTPNEWELMEKEATIRFPNNERLEKIYLALMDYFQIPVGHGEGECHNIDINIFAQNFNLLPLEVFYTIKALAQCGILYFNENFSKPSMVSFTANRDDLLEFEKTHPFFTETIKSLLRSYEGIFDAPVAIKENSLAYTLHISEIELTENLQNLHRSGIINYIPKSDLPQIVLQQNRMFKDHLYFNKDNLTALQDAYIARLKAIKAYVQDSTTCRSKMISSYFGTDNEDDCGKCDNCKNKNKAELSNSSFSTLTEKVLRSLSKNQPTAYSQLEKITSSENLKNILIYLQSEQKIKTDTQGNLYKI